MAKVLKSSETSPYGKYRHFIDTVGLPWLRELWYLRVPCLLALLAYLLFNGLDQSLEIYRAFALDLDATDTPLRGHLLRLIGSHLAVSLVSFSIWYTGRTLSLARELPQSEAKAPAASEARSGQGQVGRMFTNPELGQESFREDRPGALRSQLLALKIWPRLLSTIPLLSLGMGLFRATRGVDFGPYSQAPRALMIWSLGIVPLSLAVLLVLVIWRTQLFQGKFLGSYSQEGLFNPTYQVALATFSAVIFGLFVAFPVALPRILGTLTVVAFFLIVLLFFTSFLFFVGYRYKIPVVGGLIAIALLSSGFNSNDNHRFRQRPKAEATAASLSQSFDDWLSHRPDWEQFQQAGRPYPVYIISAQGGGIYAAYHAAITLARLQDLQPSFADHIFAISGVSGGSLGAAAFSSLVHQARDLGVPAAAASLEEQAHQFLDQDFLSPLIAAWLFPDFVQRFLPFPIEAWDRARGLEYALEASWADEFGSPNPFSGSFFDHWSPQQSAPALLLNTTVVETGDRLLLSPFQIDRPNLQDLSTYRDDLDFPLSTGTVLSARFPVATPVGWFEVPSPDGTPQRYRLADGGYFENSGVSTALDIDPVLRPKQQQVPIKLVYISIVDQYTQNLTATGLNELLSPLRALLNSREARGRSVIQQAEYSLDPNQPDNPFDNGFRKLVLDKQLADLPLGWLLSEASQNTIRAQSGWPDLCQPPSRRDSLWSNSCVAKSILDELAVASP